MDTQRAHQLVSDDAHESRGLAYPSTLLLADHERAATSTRSDYELASYPTNKGKARMYEDDDDDVEGLDGYARASGAWAREAGDDDGGTPGGTRRHSYAHAEAGRRRASRVPYAQAEETPDERRLRILWWRSAAINVLFILAWYCFSTLISLYNKWMFSADHYNFPYPLFVTSVHMLVQWCLSALTLSIFRNLRPQTKPQPRDYATKVAPCGMATGLDIGLSNLSLRTITLSFYTMCKSSSLAFVLIFAFLFRLEVPSWRLVGIILIITSGVVLMVSTETQFDAVGMMQVLTASALGGLRWSLTQLLLHKESMGMNNPIATLFWLAPIMGVTLATCSLVFDGWGNVFSHDEFWGSLGATMQTVCAIVFPGVLAFMMNITEFGLIQRTSVVTLSVAGIFKEVITIFLSTVLFHDQLTPINISGLCVTIFGIALYNYLKYRQFTHATHAAALAARQHDGGPDLDGRETGDEAYRSAGEAGDEGAPMLPVSHAHARHGSLGGGGGAKAAPHHELGSGSGSDDDERSSREGRRRAASGDSTSSFADLDAQAASLLDEFDASAAEAHSLTRLSERDKARQHDGDRIEGLEGLVGVGGGGGNGDERVERERRELDGAFEREDERSRRRDLLGDD
ncbi:hypothetical protein JCM3775_000935 [Rhodotorula graminis]